MKLRLLSALILLLDILLSCKKVPSNPNSATTSNDTLSNGWSKTTLGDGTFLDIFFGTNTGFAITDTSIYKSGDGGNSWIKISSQRGILINMGMGSDTNAAFVVHGEKIISTHNGGATFETVAFADFDLSDVFFVSPTVAYAAGLYIWKTTDGGSHWMRMYKFSKSGDYQTLYFLNEQMGWVSRIDGLYHTTDGGVNWQLVNTGTQFSFQKTNVVFFANVNHGFIADETSVGASTDGGANWSVMYSANPGYHDLHFLDDNIGYMTDGHYVLKTIDGGVTWTKDASVPSVIFYELHFIDINHGWAAGSHGTILKFTR